MASTLQTLQDTRETGNAEHANRNADERLFFPCPTGYVFAATGLVQRLQMPCIGMLALALDDDPIRISIDGVAMEHHAMALWAKDVRFDAPDTRFVTIAANPLHPSFRAYAKLEPPYVLPLDRARFGAFRELMRNATESTRFTHEEALELFNGMHATATALLPAVPALDARAQELVHLLWKNSDTSLAQLATSLDLSYHRTSHLFAETVGVPIRTYQLFQKLYRAGVPLMKGASLTEVAHTAGFVDSAHFSKAYQTANGHCPKDMFKTRRVIVYSRNVFSEQSVSELIASTATRQKRTGSKPGRKAAKSQSPQPLPAKR